MDLVHRFEAERAQRQDETNEKNEISQDGGDLSSFNSFNSSPLEGNHAQVRMFHCARCGARFDTSAGAAAKHEVYGCNYVCLPVKQGAERTLPKCESCGSYAVYREADGSFMCMSCAPKRSKYYI